MNADCGSNTSADDAHQKEKKTDSKMIPRMMSAVTEGGTVKGVSVAATLS